MLEDALAPLVSSEALQRICDLLRVIFVVELLIVAPSCSVCESCIVLGDVGIGVDCLAKVAIVAENVALRTVQAVARRTSFLNASCHLIFSTVSYAADSG